MFKLITYINASGATLNPFTCAILRSYLRDQVIVITQPMLELLNGMHLLFENGIAIKRLIIVGNRDELIEEGITEDADYVKDIRECIKLVAEQYNNSLIWLLADNATANELIWKGVIMEIHLSKNYAKRNSTIYYNSQWLDQEDYFDTSLVMRSDMEFEVVSNVRDPNCTTKSTRHYLRRNLEELALLNSMRDIINNGYNRPNRTGINTRAVFGRQYQYVMTERIDPTTGVSSFRLPLLTTKRMFARGVFAELKWFLSGSTDSKKLETQGVNIWKGNSTRTFLDSRGLDYPEGQCGPIYGYQWRNWTVDATKEFNPDQENCNGIDQVQQVVEGLQTDPFSRRHIINAWNVGDLDKMALVPCHCMYQFMVHEEDDQKYLSLMMYQRSADSFLGVPFNITSMAMFLMLMSHRVGMKPSKLIHSIGDMHVYDTHIDQVITQCQREPFMYPYVSISCNAKDKIEDYNFNDLKIEDYFSYPRISAPMAV